MEWILQVEKALIALTLEASVDKDDPIVHPLRILDLPVWAALGVSCISDSREDVAKFAPDYYLRVSLLDLGGLLEL